LKRFKKPYREGLRRFLKQGIATPYVYVSLDLDVGAYRAVHAARYMDGLGISRKAIMQAASFIAEICSSGASTLAGIDVMEFNMHLLGLEREPGKRDRTAETALSFVEQLLNKQGRTLDLSC